MDFKHIVKLTDIVNYVFNKAKSLIPCASLSACFTVLGKYLVNSHKQVIPLKAHCYEVKQLLKRNILVKINNQGD